MADIRLNRIGIDFRHEPGFLVDRPEGAEDCIFLRFTVPVRMDRGDGPFPLPAGACWLHRPPCKLWYHGDGTGLENDWLHFDGDAVLPLAERYGLPFNEPLLPRRTDAVEPILREMFAEMHHPDRHSPRAGALLLERLFLALAREIDRRRDAPVHPRAAERLPAFRLLREEMLQQCTRPWTVAEMAGRVHLSASRFSVLYNRFFGASPMDDLIRKRIETAKWLLDSTALSVESIAYECGFSNVPYFCRAFRKRAGVPPGRYGRRG